MRTQISMRTLLVTSFLCLPAEAQSPRAGDATDVSRQEIAGVRARMGNSVDRQLKIVDVGGQNVGIGILRRTPDSDTDGQHRGMVHTAVTEVYHILEGAGTLLTGGQLYNQSEVRIPGEGVEVGPSFTAEARGGRNPGSELGRHHHYPRRSAPLLVSSARRSSLSERAVRSVEGSPERVRQP